MLLPTRGRDGAGCRCDRYLVKRSAFEKLFSFAHLLLAICPQPSLRRGYLPRYSAQGTVDMLTKSS